MTGVQTCALPISLVLQDVPTIFETDLFRPLFEVAEGIAGVRQGDGARSDVSLRVIAEHGRATTFLIADGVLPSNEGRGYVLRRMLRRVVSHARRLGIERPVIAQLAETTIEHFGPAYPELLENRAYILQVAGSEEERFAATLRQGMALFEDAVAKTPSAGSLAGDVVFKLHDTFGFPKELTRELVEDVGLAIDDQKHLAAMGALLERVYAQPDGHGGWQPHLAENVAAIRFVGVESTIVASDLGQPENVGWIDGLASYVRGLHHVSQLIQETPRRVPRGAATRHPASWSHDARNNRYPSPPHRFLMAAPSLSTRSRQPCATS